jgi:hypothetical protein
MALPGPSLAHPPRNARAAAQAPFPDAHRRSSSSCAALEHLAHSCGGGSAGDRGWEGWCVCVWWWCVCGGGHGRTPSRTRYRGGKLVSIMKKRIPTTRRECLSSGVCGGSVCVCGGPNLILPPTSLISLACQTRECQSRRGHSAGRLVAAEVARRTHHGIGTSCLVVAGDTGWNEEVDSWPG